MSPAFDLFRLLNALTDNQVDFIVIGGVAVVAHGPPIATFDLDICYSRDYSNLERLAATLRELGAKLRGVPDDVPFLVDADTLAAGDHFTFITQAGDFDIMATPAGSKGFEQLKANAVSMDFDGLNVFVAGIDDLIRMKEVAGRDKDTSALAHLERLRDELEGR